MPKGRLITEFRTKKAVKSSQRAFDKALKDVGKEMQAVMRDKVNTKYPPASIKNNPPHRRSGDLWRSITVTSSRGVIRIRTIRHGFFLEGGTSRMDPRPFVRPTLFAKGQRTKWATKIAKRALELTGGKGTKKRGGR